MKSQNNSNNNNNSKSGGGTSSSSSWKQVKVTPTPPTNANTTTTSTKQTGGWKSGHHSDQGVDMVSILSAPPPTTKRVFDPTTINQPQINNINNGSNLNSSSNSSFTKRKTSIGQEFSNESNSELTDQEVILDNDFNDDIYSTDDSEEVDQDILKKILDEEDNEDLVLDESIRVEDILKEISDDEDGDQLLREINQTILQSPLKQAEEKEKKLLSISECNLPMLWRFKNSRRSTNGIVVEPQSYSKISEQLTSEEIRKVVGFPTCFSVAKYIAIGTSHGYIMIFNYNQELLSIIGGSIVADCGPVTAADFPRCKVNEDWLISGHQSGHCLIWDITTGKPIKVIDKIHKCAITHLKFFADGQRYISSDSQGITFVVSIVKGFMAIGIDHQLLLNGNLGPILSIQPLLPGNFVHPTDKSNIVALATSRKILVISATTEGVYILNNKITKPKYITSQTVLPYLSWRRVTFQKSIGHTKPLEPILAIGWGTNIQLLQIVTAPNDQKFMNPEFIVVAEYQTDFDICGLEWLDQIILFLNSKDELRVFDPFALEEVESINIKSMQLVHQTSKKKDSQISIYSFHNSIRINKNRIYFLGMKGVFTAHILTWLERLSILVSNNQYFEALCLALDFYEGKAKATTGLSINTVDLKLITAEKIVEILSQFCYLVFQSNNPNNNNNNNNNSSKQSSTISITTNLIPKQMLIGMDKEIESYNQFQQLALISIEFCVLIKRTDLLFGEIFNYYSEAGIIGTFLEFLEPYILNDRLTHLNPEVMQYMMTHYQEKGILIRAEQCVLHLDIASIDFHQTVLLCRKHGLFSALIYLYNKGLNDYVTPMEDMMEVLIPNPHPSNNNNQIIIPKESKEQVAYRLLLYLQYCLSGKSFPTGQIPSSRIPTLKAEVYEYIYHRTSFPEDQSAYPRLYNLLMLDTTECLKIISPGFYDKGFWTAETQKQPLTVLNLPFNYPINRNANNLNNFNMISILLLIMIDKSQQAFEPKDGVNKNWSFDLQNQGQLLCLLGRCYADGLLTIDQPLFNRIVGMLSIPPVTNLPLFTSHDRQKVLLDILQMKNSFSAQIDLEKLILHFEANEFYQVCKYLYSLKRNFNKMILCHIKDPELKHSIFEYIKQLLSDQTLIEEQRVLIRNTTISNLAQLILIDSTKTAQIIMDCFSSDHEKILKELSSFPKLQYTYLQGLIGTATQNKNNNNNANNNNSSPILGNQQKIHISNETHELYIKLMCIYQSELVYRYLVSHDDYPLDSCLKICQQYNNFEGATFLLERTGDVFKALDMFLNILNRKIEDLIKHFATVFANVKQLKNQNTTQLSPQEKEVRDDLNSAIALCQRNSPRLQDQENESLWFKLFDSIVIFIKQIKISHHQSNYNTTTTTNNSNSNSNQKPAIYTKTLQFLTKLSHMILNSMMGYVALPIILSKIVNEYGMSEYGDFKSIISDMLDTCSFETSILVAANQLIQIDMYNATTSLVNKLNRGYLPVVLRCCMCTRPLSEFSHVQPSTVSPNQTNLNDSVLIFQCDHAFHSECLGGKHGDTCPMCSKENVSTNKKNDESANNNNTTSSSNINQTNLDAQKVAIEKERDRRDTLKYLDRLNNYSNLTKRKPLYNLDIFEKRLPNNPNNTNPKQQTQRKRSSKPPPPKQNNK